MYKGDVDSKIEKFLIKLWVCTIIYFSIKVVKAHIPKQIF